MLILDWSYAIGFFLSGGRLIFGRQQSLHDDQQRRQSDFPRHHQRHFTLFFLFFVFFL